MESYHTILKEAGAELVEKKSRFIGTAFPAGSEEAALGFLAQCKNKHWDARHHCYAYVLRDNNILRYSDDGEPQGTAGMPILEVIRREGVTDLILVVTRYFGGTLLGAGGLVRAYTKAASLAIQAAERVEMCECALFRIPTPYPLYERVLKLLEDYPAQLSGTDFAGDVAISGRMRLSSVEGFRHQLTELTSGTVGMEILSKEFAAI